MKNPRLQGSLQYRNDTMIGKLHLIKDEIRPFFSLTTPSKTNTIKNIMNHGKFLSENICYGQLLTGI